MKRILSAPTIVNLELTEACNARCRYCYNFWRNENQPGISLDNTKMNQIIDAIVDAGIFHVVLSGGEPLVKFELLEKALLRLRKENISVSCNSNLFAMDDAKAKKLRETGLDHILTSLPSPDADQSDYIMNTKNSLNRIYSGIEACIRNDIRVSVNMVITKKNANQVNQAGKIASDLGVQKLFITRGVPPVYEASLSDNDLLLSPTEYKKCLEDAIQVRDEFDLMIGSLVSYPLCFLGDLNKFKDFVGRGCPSQAGHRLNINANGDVHACVHEKDVYGNVFDMGIRDIFQGSMRKWHNSDLHYSGCEGCRYLDICESGCRMNALGYFGSCEREDPLYVGPHVFEKRDSKNFLQLASLPIESKRHLIVPERIRFRKENGFYLLNIRWGNSITVPSQVAEFLIENQSEGKHFKVNALGEANKEILWQLYLKDAIEDNDSSISRKRNLEGLSLNPDLLN